MDGDLSAVGGDVTAVGGEALGRVVEGRASDKVGKGKEEELG